jgi:hypothetical protein
VLGVAGVEEPARLVRPDERGARQHGRHRARLDEQLGRADLDLVHERDGGECRARPHRRLEAVHLHQRVADRGAEVEHDVRVVQQARARRVPRRRRERLRPRGDRDHRQPARARLPRDLDRDGGPAARAEDHHHVLGAQLEVGQDRPGEPLDPLDEHRLALAVRADDLGVVGHAQLDDRVEARVRAVAREHLLDGDPRVARAEEVHQPAAADRPRAEGAGALDLLRLGALDPLEHLARRLDPLCRRRRRHSAGCLDD